jgi:uncharacterized membrane protein YhhN
MLPNLGSTLLVGAAGACGLHLRAAYRGPRWQVYLFKPLTTLLLLGIAASAPAAHGATYRLTIMIGLLLSLSGDVFLMLPQDRFIAGLGSFLLAHLAYITGFALEGSMGSAPRLLLPLGVVALLLLRLLWPRLGGLRIPVVLYTATIVVMVWRAWARSRMTSTPGTALAAAGAALFMMSDALLALNRFRRPFRSAQALVQVTYVAAQACIAMSVGVV